MAWRRRWSNSAIQAGVGEMGVGGYQAKRDLRGWAPQRRAQGKAAMVGHRDQACIHLHQMLDIRTVDPDVAGTQPIRSPAGDRLR